ncbi:MAG: superoxide dismutase [Ni] [Desulfopila sp.]|jgi:nickel superoxide dismutase|nr:superoxide dismutase [Ni] [Desulfopila sp.]
MFKYAIHSFTLIAILFFSAAASWSHCEIPCGIYDDKMRITMLEEHIATMEKSMGQILDLEKGNNNNQLIRWVMNKEDHAEQFQNIVTQYFMTQRIKPDEKMYHEELALLHQMLIYAMKAKQTVDLENITKLKELVTAFDKLYFAPH